MDLERTPEPLMLSPTLSLVRFGETWILEDPRVGLHRIVNQLPTWLCDFLASSITSHPGTPKEWESRAEACGVPVSRAPGCVRSLQRAHLLVNATLDPYNRESAPLRDFQLMVCSTPANYGEPGVVKADTEQMSEFSRTSAPPAPYHSFPDAAHLPLPHPFLDHTDHPLGDVARLLYLGNAVLQDVAIGPLHRTRRVPPSHGASHPFDLVLSLGEPWVHTPGTFYYNPDTHHLVSLSGLPDADAHAEFVAECLGSTGAKGAVSVAFHLEVRRIQWRYRTSTAYPTIFLDLGHLVETLAYVARDMDWAMTHIPVAFQPPLAALEYTFGPIMGLCQLHPANGNTHERPAGE